MSDRSSKPSSLSDAAELAALAELAAELRERSLPGERLIDTHRRLADEAVERRRWCFLLEQIVEGLPINIFAKDREHRYVLANRNVRNIVGREREEVLGRTDFDILPAAGAACLRASDERLRASGGSQREELEVAQADGRTGYLYVGKRMVRFPQTGEELLVGFSIDISDRRRMEQELRDKLALIEEQRAAIRLLSTPIIEVWDRVLTAPVLGVLDSERAGRLLESLLSAVRSTGARFTILDLTGVEAMDAATAGHLLRLFGAVRLLGAEGILTGIAPAAAQAIVGLGVDLAGVTTLANLREALRYCIRRLRGGDV